MDLVRCRLRPVRQGMSREAQCRGVWAGCDIEKMRTGWGSMIGRICATGFGLGLVQGCMRKTLRKRAVLGALVGIAVVALVAVTLWSAGSRTKLRLVGMQDNDGWATAEFVVKSALGVPWVRDVGVGSTAKIHVLRGGEWVELTQSEMRQRIAIDGGIQPAGGGQRVGSGYTVKVKVPTCEKWKMEIDMGEQRTIGFAMIGFQYDTTQHWETGELAGPKEEESAKEI